MVILRLLWLPGKPKLLLVVAIGRYFLLFARLLQLKTAATLVLMRVPVDQTDDGYLA